MAEDEGGSVEILVHTSAPSRGRDDAHYRATALAYQQFEPLSRLSLNHLDRDGETGDDKASFSKTQADCQSWNYISTDLHLESPQVSFSSALDNLDSPALLRPGRITRTPPPTARREIGLLVTTDHESSWETPPSVILDSQSPCNRAFPEFSSPTRVLELYLQNFDVSGSVSAIVDSDRASQASSTNLYLASSQPQSSSPRQTTQYSAPSGTDESLQFICDTPYIDRRRKSTSPQSSGEKLVSPRKANSPPRAQSVVKGSNQRRVPLSGPKNRPVRARSTPQSSPQSKRRKIEVPGTIIKSPASQHHQQRKPPPQPQPPPSKPCRLPSRITPQKIHPPPPRTSSWATDSPSNSSQSPPIITPALQLLATQLELSHRYRPKVQTRPLRPLERGYWAISMVQWSPLLREQAWAALGAYLGQGRAGWGVWAVKCCSDGGDGGDGVAWEDVVDDVGREREGGRGRMEREEQEQLHEGLRVFCWGGVAGHVYLLLYLVSQRTVKGTGARWVDGGGDVVVRMP